MRKLTRRPTSVGVLPLAVVVLLAGCGGDAVPAAPPPAPTEPPPAAVPPPPAPTASATAEAPAPSASASAAAAAPKPQSSGRPSVIKSDPVEITDSFGSSPGGKINIGDKEIATLKIPEATLAQATNITFKLDTKGKAGGALVGKIYHVIAMIPPESKPTPVPSNNGTPFELALPTGGKKNLNLAIGANEVNDKGQEKLKWTVIAPKRTDDGAGLAYFELDTLNDAFLHLTTKPPTEAKK